MNNLPEMPSNNRKGLDFAHGVFHAIANENDFSKVEMLNDGNEIWFSANGKKSETIERSTLEKLSPQSIYNEIKNAIESVEMGTTKKLQNSKQPGDNCYLIFGHGMAATRAAKILKVHFTRDKVQYDVEALIDAHEDPTMGWNRIRFYNVDEKYVKNYGEEPIANAENTPS